MSTIYITNKQKNMLKSVINEEIMGITSLLTEENGSQRKQIENAIKNNCSSYISDYLETPLAEAPTFIKQCFNGGDHEGGLYTAVSNAPRGTNKVIDFLRLNLYGQFGMGRDSKLFNYTQGIGRISCAELGFYSFSPQLMQGGKIIKFGKVLKLIDKIPNFIPEDLHLDKNFNGMTYDQFMDVFAPLVQKYTDDMNSSLGADNSYSDESHYTIIPIQDEIQSSMGSVMCKPTPHSQRLLSSLSQYTDWCICGPQGEFEYAQYVSNGGKFYICLRDDYKNVPREQGPNCPIDDYGLSMIAVIVGSDGLPDNVTTRWNHEFGGENHSEMWEAIHLQKVLKVNYKDVFKPRSARELSSMHIEENRFNKEKPLLNESIDENYDYKKDMKSIAEFMKKEGVNVYPYPKVKLDWKEQNGLFIKTGYYSPEDKTIVVFCKDRHPKDILRTFAHEMIHHSQNLNGMDLNFSSEDDVKDNKKLEDVEGEAYLKGNIYFRKWTEYKKQQDFLNESININPKNKGKFNATKKKTGKSTEELTHSKNPITKKRAIFAQNAKKWNKKK